MEMDRKSASKKLKKVLDKLDWHAIQYKKLAESEQALKKALNIENFIV